MIQMLALTAPFFAVALIGYASVHRGLLHTSAVRPFNTFAFYFAAPSLIIAALSRQDFTALIDFPFLAGYLTAGLSIYGITALFGRWMFGLSWSESAVAGQGASVSNIGFLGLPLVLIAFGDAGAVPVTLALVVDLVVLIPLTLAVLEGARGGRGSAGYARAASGLMFNPFIWSIILGLAASAIGGLPVPVTTLLDFLGQAAAPVGMFALGMSLYGRPVSDGVGQVSMISLTKLVVHPALAYAALTGFGADPTWVAVGTVVAAMPVAGNVFIIAEQYSTFTARASTAILATTAFAAFTAALVLALVQTGS